MPKYLLIFKITSNGIVDYSREKIVECEDSQLIGIIQGLKIEFVGEAKKEMGPYATSASDDYRESKANAQLVQALKL